MSKRPAMTQKRRMEVWIARNGTCYLCRQKVKATETWDVEHRIAWSLSKDDSMANLEVAHREGCHKAKTKTDAGTIAKAKRQAGEKGQQARRKKKGGSIPSAPFPKWQKAKWPSRPFPKKDKPK